MTIASTSPGPSNQSLANNNDAAATAKNLVNKIAGRNSLANFLDNDHGHDSSAYMLDLSPGALKAMNTPSSAKDPGSLTMDLLNSLNGSSNQQHSNHGGSLVDALNNDERSYDKDNVFADIMPRSKTAENSEKANPIGTLLNSLNSKK
jgi:hypothetical protein